MIAIAILILVSVILIVGLLKNHERYITLAEVIPEARILSQEEGIIEYKGVQYILGTHNLKRKKYLIESLNLVDLESPCVVDLRFNTQVIIKGGPSFKKRKPGPEDMQSRRK